MSNLLKNRSWTVFIFGQAPANALSLKPVESSVN